MAFILILTGVILGTSSIDANVSNRICYLPYATTQNLGWFLSVFDVIPSFIFIFISLISVIYSVKTLRREITIIQKADLVSDDLNNLIHRLIGFLIMSLFSAIIIVGAEAWWLMGNKSYGKTAKKWIECSQNLSQINGGFDDNVGDTCHNEVTNTNAFPPILLFVSFPIAILLRLIYIYCVSNIYISVNNI